MLRRIFEVMKGRLIAFKIYLLIQFVAIVGFLLYAFYCL